MNDKAVYDHCLELPKASLPGCLVDENTMNEIASMAGLGMLERFKRDSKRRTSHAKIIRDRLAVAEDNFLVEIPHTQSFCGDHFTLIIGEEEHGIRKDFRSALLSHKVPNRRMHSVIGRQAVRNGLFGSAPMEALRDALPGASAIWDRGLRFPVHASWSSREARRLGGSIMKAITESA
jgi:dTDP-4-amino-4,6-dideoxygalactose transaminase